MKKFICNLDALLSGISLIIIVLITVAGVIMRKFIGQPIAWLEEMQIFFFVWLVFLGGSLAFRMGNQVSIDLIAARLSDRSRNILEIIDYLVSIIVISYMLYGGWKLMHSPSVIRKVTPYFKIGYAWIDLAVPIGCALMILQYTVIIINRLIKWKKEDK